MLPLTETIIKAFNMVKETDKQIGDVWKMPSPEDCIRYAVTECAEVINADIVSRNPDHARNRPQDADVDGELRDTLMMCIKYFIASGMDIQDVVNGMLVYHTKRDLAEPEDRPLYRISELMYNLASALESSERYSDYTNYYMIRAISMLFTRWPQDQLLFLLEEKLERTKEKVAAKQLYMKNNP